MLNTTTMPFNCYLTRTLYVQILDFPQSSRHLIANSSENGFWGSDSSLQFKNITKTMFQQTICQVVFQEIL